MQTTQMTLGKEEGCPQGFTLIKRLRGSIESIKNALLASFHGVTSSIPNPVKKVKPSFSLLYIFIMIEALNLIILVQHNAYRVNTIELIPLHARGVRDRVSLHLLQLL